MDTFLPVLEAQVQDQGQVVGVTPWFTEGVFSRPQLVAGPGGALGFLL